MNVRNEALEEAACKVESVAGSAGGFIAAEIRALKSKPVAPKMSLFRRVKRWFFPSHVASWQADRRR